MKAERIKNLQDALSFAVSGVASLPRSSWIEKGKRSRDNENVELPRALLRELAQKAIQYFQVVDQLPYDPFCNCKQIEGLLLEAIAALPDGELADSLEQITLHRCPNCGQPFDKEGEGLT